MSAQVATTSVTTMRTAQILLGLIIAPAKKDLLGMDTYAQVKKLWVKPIETKIKKRRNLDHFFVTNNSLRDGIVLWELQEQKCQQHVCQHSDVVQSGQAGWMVLILQWKMVKFTGRSALVANKTTIAKTSKTFLSRTVDPTLFTNLISQLYVTSVTVVQTERQAEKK